MTRALENQVSQARDACGRQKDKINCMNANPFKTAPLARQNHYRGVAPKPENPGSPGPGTARGGPKISDCGDCANWRAVTENERAASVTPDDNLLTSGKVEARNCAAMS